MAAVGDYDRWLPIPLSAGMDCEVGCSMPARWTRKLRVRPPGEMPKINRTYRCDDHAPAAYLNRRNQPCAHRPGPCRICPELAARDPLASHQPWRRHQLLTCPGGDTV